MNCIKSLIVSFLLVISIFLNGCSSKENSVIEPNVPNNFVLRPVVELYDSELRAGTAFAVKLEGHNMPIIITALHIFGPNGGLEKDIL